MLEHTISLPSKPKIVEEKGSYGIYEIDGLYPGYGHTLGNSLRRIVLSSLPGAAITHVKIKGVEHEFSTLNGVKEDVITILLNLKKLDIQVHTSENQTLRIKKKGIGAVTGAEIEAPGQVTILNPKQHIAEVTDKNTELDIELTVETGIGYVSKESLQKERVDIGSITVDASFTPIRRVNYEVENMRVGNRTDFNRLRISIETDSSLTPREALEKSIEIMIHQLKAIVGFKEERVSAEVEESASSDSEESDDNMDDVLKTRIETLDLSTRIVNSLTNANIRTIGGLARKKEADILALEGMGEKGVEEIKTALKTLGISLKA